MIRSGEVVEKSGGLLSITFERPAACENCGGCLERRCTTIDLPGDAEVGDRVEVELPDKHVVGASAIAYLVPLAMFFAGLFLGMWLHGLLRISMNRDLFAALAAGVLLGMGALTVRGIDRRLREKQSWQPRIVAVHPRQ